MEKSLVPRAVIIGIAIFAVGTAFGSLLGREKPLLTQAGSTAVAASSVHTATKPLRNTVMVFGVAMNQPLALPECVKKDLKFFGSNDPSLAIYNGSVTCFVEFKLPAADEAKERAEVDPAFRSRREYSVKLPTGSRPSYVTNVSVSTLHNRVAEIQIDTTGDTGQEDAFADLKSKFGAPTSVNSKALQNGFGAQFEGIDAFWNFPSPGITIELDGIDASRDRGNITMRNQDFANALRDLDARHPSPHL